jgi:hypothetical protein
LLDHAALYRRIAGEISRGKAAKRLRMMAQEYEIRAHKLEGGDRYFAAFEVWRERLQMKPMLTSDGVALPKRSKRRRRIVRRNIFVDFLKNRPQLRRGFPALSVSLG